MIVLDTAILSLLDYHEGASYERLARRLSDPGAPPAACTIISVEEQMRGWLSYIAGSRKIDREVEGYRRLHVMLRSYRDRTILDFDAAAKDQFNELRRMRIRVGTMDLKIAAIALCHNATVITQNISDFSQIPRLRVEDWTC